MKVCPTCGREVDTKFCPDCGTMVEVEAEIVEDVVFEVIEEKELEAEPEEASYEVRQEIVPVPYTERVYEQQQEPEKDPKVGKFSAKSTGIVAYIGWIGLIIAVLLGDREGGKFHLNQALVIYLASIIFSVSGSLIPFLGTLVAVGGAIFTLVCWGMGLYYACTGQEKEVPLIGQIRLL